MRRIARQHATRLICGRAALSKAPPLLAAEAAGVAVWKAWPRQLVFCRAPPEITSLDQYKLL